MMYIAVSVRAKGTSDLAYSLRFPKNRYYETMEMSTEVTGRLRYL